MTRYYFLAICILYLTISCSSSKINPEKLKEKFYQNEKELTKLALSLRASELMNTKKCEGCLLFLSQDKLDKGTAEQFKTLGLKDVLVFHWRCSSHQFDFTTNWSEIIPVHLAYNTCDSIETVKGFYKKDKNSNEFWGLGNNWSMWTEIKLREPGE